MVRLPLRRAVAIAPILVGALVAVLVLAGCAAVVVGRPSPSPQGVREASPAEVPITGATNNPVDQLTRDALADLQAYWTQQFPDVFGRGFVPLKGGYFSVDPSNIDPAAYPHGVGCGQDPRSVENNAYYCQAAGAPNSDSITYDRAFLGELGDQFGRFIPALVMAHEFGHAVQARVGSPPRSIAAETQADCFAGAWTSWVADGHAQYSFLRTPELDQLLRGYMQLRDPVGTSPGQPQAHGSFFDRAAAFQEGFDDGPTACRDHFGADRVFTQGTFSDADLLTRGNAPYGQLLSIIGPSLPEVWGQAFQEVFARPFQAPRLQPFDGEAPSCAPDRALELVYCPGPRLVGFDQADLTRPAYDKLGDYAVATAISIPYGLAVRDELGRSTDDPAATRSAVCLTGWYTAKVFNHQAPGVDISPGDVDEAVEFLLLYGPEPRVLPHNDRSGFELFDLFRNGFDRGLPACDVGV